MRKRKAMGRHVASASRPRAVRGNRQRAARAIVRLQKVASVVVLEKLHVGPSLRVNNGVVA